MLALAATVATGCTTPTPAPVPTTSPTAPGTSAPPPATLTAARPFAADSPINAPISPTPSIDEASEAMVAYAAREGRAYVNLYQYGVPIYLAGPDDPGYPVSCTREGEWGPCPLGGTARRIPDGAKPSPGSDGALVVIQPDGSIDEYWQARRDGDTWSASWGAVNSLDGSGWGGESTGAGVSRLAGVVRVDEIRDGVIKHALVMQTNNVCADVFRPPALKTDGDSTRRDCIPEGARLQLDPTLDLDTLKGLRPAERTVARALQVYGAYLVDRSGTSLSLSFETAPDATRRSPGAVYKAAGLTHDYYGLPHIPWERLRVLSRWDG